MKVNIREKKLVMGTLAVALVVLGYYYVVEPFIESQQRIAAELATGIAAATQNQFRVSRKEKLEHRLSQLKQEYTELEAGLLPGAKAPLAAAELQKIIKTIVKKRKGVKIISEKVLEPVELGNYQRIAVQVTISCLVTRLKEVIYRLENNRTMLNISQVNIRVANQRHPKDIKTTIIVEGAIRRGEDNA